MYGMRHTWMRDGFRLLQEDDLHLRAVIFCGGKGRAGRAPSTSGELVSALLTPTHAPGTTEETLHTPPSPSSSPNPKTKQARGN